jgi:thiol:disulfide interchange protein DsbC
MHMKKTLLAAATLLVASHAFANSVEDKIRQTVSQSLEVPVEKVTKAGFGDLYEVVSPQGIAYTDKNASFVIFNGVAIDTATKTNLTEKRTEELSRFDWKDLPLKDAIKVVRGNGSRVIATLEDPNCGFCKRLATEVQKMDNVTIYTFLLPVLGDDSVKKAKSIWCSQDRAKAWNAQMLENTAPTAAGNCDTPIERNQALGRKLRVNGTPAILFQNGTRVPGYMTADKLEVKLSEKVAQK